MRALCWTVPGAERVVLLWPWNTISVYDNRVIDGEDTIDALTSDGLRVNAEPWYRYRPLTDSLGALYKLVDAHSSTSAMLTSWQWGAVPADGCALPCTDDRPDRAQHPALQLCNFCTWNAKP